MFNSYSADNSARINVNAVCGTLVKNYQKSFFVRFQLGSSFGDKLLSSNPIITKNHGDVPVVVIQCMCAGGKNGNEMIAEVMWKKDVDSLFEQMGE